MLNHAPGNLFIVAAPSGGGKTSLVKALVEGLPNIEVSISHTTRDQRTGEVDGVDYFFIPENDFLAMIANNAFVEYAQVFNQYYGTAFAQIQERLSQGIDVVLDIDWQGSRQIKSLFPEAVAIFVIPPSLEVLRERLTLRKRDKKQVIKERMHSAQTELSHYTEFDYLIVNDNFENAAQQLQAIVLSQRLRIGRQIIEQKELLSFLLASE